MSEPVIKPKAMYCSKCHGTPGEWHFEHANDVVLQPLYTHDDFVEVAGAAAVRAGFHGDVEAFARDVVDRLTKGDV